MKLLNTGSVNMGGIKHRYPIRIERTKKSEPMAGLAFQIQRDQPALETKERQPDKTMTL